MWCDIYLYGFQLSESNYQYRYNPNHISQILVRFADIQPFKCLWFSNTSMSSLRSLTHILNFLNKITHNFKRIAKKPIKVMSHMTVKISLIEGVSPLKHPQWRCLNLLKLFEILRLQLGEILHHYFLHPYMCRKPRLQIMAWTTHGINLH